jgi:adenosylmethionine-8-amino-7-oxononanoate aminotransferase
MPYALSKNLNHTPLKVTGGEGVWIEVDGRRRLLDTCGGVAVSSLGHRHPRIIEAMKQHSEDLAWAHAGVFKSDATENLAEFLVRRAGRGLTHAQFLSGGSEAMELALKVAYQYHHERGESQRNIFISRRQSYHGCTLGTLSVSGNISRRAIYDPFFFGTEKVSPCYAYRGKREGETDPEYAKRLGMELDEKIQAIGPQRVAAFIAEPVVGSTMGAVPAVEGYFREISKTCKKHGVLLILDDIMSGMGRSGSLFSHNDDDVTPDIVTVGKGLAAGYQPISAYFISEDIHDTIKNGSGILLNGQTNVNHPYACAIALEVQQTIEHEELLTAVQMRGQQFKDGLNSLLEKYDFIGDIRGRGMFFGIEFVEDDRKQSPIKNGQKLLEALNSFAMNEDLLIYPGAGTVDGKLGAHILFAPPFIASKEEIEEMIDRIDRVFSNISMKAVA